MRKAIWATLVVSALVVGLVSIFAFPLLTWDFQMRFIRAKIVEPDNQLQTVFSIEVMPGEEDNSGYRLQTVEVTVNLQAYRLKEDGTIDDWRIAGSGALPFTVPDGETSFSYSSAEVKVGSQICAKIEKALDEGYTGFYLLFIPAAEGLKDGIPVLGTAKFVEPIDHEKLCESS